MGLPDIVKEVRNWIILGLIIVSLIAVSSAIYSWYKPPEIISKTEYVSVNQIKEVIKIQKVNVPGPKEIITIDKPVIVEKLKLPDWFKNDVNKQAISTAEISPYKGTTNVVSVLDTKTGEGSIIAKQLPMSLVGFVNEREIGIRGGYGVDRDGTRGEVGVYGRWDFLRVGDMYLGVYGEGNTRGDAKMQLSIGYKW